MAAPAQLKKFHQRNIAVSRAKYMELVVCSGVSFRGGTGLKARTKIDQNSAQQILRSWAGVDDGVGRISPKSITEAMLSRAFRPVVSVAARAEAGTYTCLVAPLFMCRDAHDW
jgi:hypothetical protein